MSAPVAPPADSPWLSPCKRRQQRSAKREAVLRAAARLFLGRGFQGTSLDDIAASLGVSKPTVYLYVANKEEILLACARNGLDGLRQGIAQATGRGVQGRDRLHAAMACYAQVATSDFGQCVIRIGEEPLGAARRLAMRALKAEIDAEFRALIADGMAQGWIAAGDADLAAHTVVGALSGVGRWYQPGQHSAESLAVAVDHCIAVLMRGVLVAPAAGPPDRAEQAMPADLTQTHAENQAWRRELHFGDRVLRCLARRPRHLAGLLADAVAARPHGDALVCDGLQLDWCGLHHAVSRCAGGLAQRGVRPGDRLALLLPNGAEFVIATLACAWLGAVLVPINARVGAAELAFVLADAECAAIVCDARLVGLLPPPASLPALRLWLASGAPAVPGFEPLAVLLQAPALLQPHEAAEDELAVLLYTSGTTGQPKGAMLTHLNIAHSVQHYAHLMGLGPADRSVAAVPLSHVTGLVAQLYTLLACQGCLVVMPEFKAAGLARLIEQQRITHAILVPAMYSLLLLLPDLGAHDLSTWRIGAFGGAAMPTATIEALARRLPRLTLMNAYGATETCSPATLMPPGHTSAHADSVGLPVPCADILVVDDAGRELPPGQVGEILVAGPMVVPGYWRDAAATRTGFCGGYWRSGDLGTQDAQGYLRIVDRKKDVINRGGYKVFSVAVENTLAEHPQVVEAALVGRPCAVLGERVHAFVHVRAAGAGSQAEDLRQFCAERLADYAVPETWSIGTDPLPRNPNGKLMKRLLRQSLQAALN